MPRGPKPARIRVRMYQVGFGDCFLLSFEYDKALADGRSERHVLIDFGSTRLARGRGLRTVAELIREHSGGHLDAVVVSHRHKDHLSAFGDGEIAELLATDEPPSLIVRSWTEDPAAAKNAVNGNGANASARFLANLREARKFADQLVKSIIDAPRSVVGEDLRQLASDQLSNAKAVRQLEKWGKASQEAFVHYGQSSHIEDVIPGITVRVLGPPTIEQHPDVRTQRDEDPGEFWMLYKRLLANTAATKLISDAGKAELLEDADTSVEAEESRPRRARRLGPIGPTRWLIDRMGRQQANSFLRIVRILDSALNNTSLILLFEVGSAGGTKRLLFGGDAQIENWEYALKFAPDSKANRKALKLVDLYKVGHHGSRNATPRTLFNLWQEPDTAERDMVALMSTKAGVHGKHAETAVPRKTLVNALDRRMTLHSTEDFATGQDFVELMADLNNGGRFAKVKAPK